MRQFKTLLTLLVLLMTAATGTAWAQSVTTHVVDDDANKYTAKLKDGVQDADLWTITPAEASTDGVYKGTEVTLTYSGRLKVKSVKATVAEKSDLLNGKFSVSATKQVQFAKGNLQATTTDLGETWTWGFAENQWDCIGDAAANNTINGIGTVSTNGTVDLFEWVGASSTWTGAAQYGISNSISGKTDGHGNVADEALKSDWGTTMGTGWRTLTSDEWLWIFGPIDSPNPGTNCRTSSTVGGTANGRFAKATVNGKAGVILFPDSYTHPDGVTAPANVNIANSAAHYDGNNYNATDWGKMEAAGAVFLVAGGIRDNRYESQVLGAGNNCIYWSSSPFTSSADEACGIRIQNAGMNPQFDYFRSGGFAVRLVKDAQ